MKYILLLLAIAFNFNLLAQTDDDDKQAVLEIVNKFFTALEKRDTTLLKSIAFTNSQIWVSRNVDDSVKTQMRYVSDDVVSLPKMKEVIEERPLKVEIDLHGNIAVVWAPYILSFSGKFSHCGIDVFTLLKANGGWKIVSLAYSAEPNGCDVIKKKYHIQ